MIIIILLISTLCLHENETQKGYDSQNIESNQNLYSQKQLTLKNTITMYESVKALSKKQQYIVTKTKS